MGTITTYDNFVLENKTTDLLNTKLNINALYTVDNSLETAAGLKKVINKYTYSGTVEKLAKGAKNTVKGSVSFVPSEYEVERYQQTFVYNDMDVMKDPYCIDAGLRGMSDVMGNEIRDEYFDEIDKVSNEFGYSTFNYDAIVDALAELNLEVEDGLFILMGNDLKKAIRKDDDFKASKQGEILYSGQFGTISGVPVCFSKKCPKGIAFISKKDAVTMYVKKNGSIEQDHDIESKDNTVVYERHGIMALTDETHSIRLGAAATTATTITTYTKATKAVAGACTTGATVKVYVNGELKKTATGASSAYSVTLDDNLAIGDIVKVVARKDGQVSSSATVTVAA